MNEVKWLLSKYNDDRLRLKYNKSTYRHSEYTDEILPAGFEFKELEITELEASQYTGYEQFKSYLIKLQSNLYQELLK